MGVYLNGKVFAEFNSPPVPQKICETDTPPPSQLKKVGNDDWQLAIKFFFRG